MIDAIKDRPKKIAAIKQNYNFKQEQLVELHRYICQMLQIKYLTPGEFTALLRSQFGKMGHKWQE